MSNFLFRKYHKHEPEDVNHHRLKLGDSVKHIYWKDGVWIIRDWVEMNDKTFAIEISRKENPEEDHVAFEHQLTKLPDQLRENCDKGIEVDCKSCDDYDVCLNNKLGD